MAVVAQQADGKAEGMLGDSTTQPLLAKVIINSTCPGSHILPQKADAGRALTTPTPYSSLHPTHLGVPYWWAC